MTLYDRKTGEQGEEIAIGKKIARVWKNEDTQEFTIDGKTYPKGDFEHFIESQGLRYSNPYNIVQQGKITQVSLMDEF